MKYKVDLGLNNLNVLVTGASGGIGKEIAIKMALCGANVYLHYNQSIREAESSINYIKNAGGSCRLIHADFNSTNDISNMFDKLENENVSIDILINNAGIISEGYSIGVSEEQWERTVNVNLKAAFLCSKYVSRSMIRKKRGCIINITSTVTEKILPMQSAYISSKFGLVGLTRALAKELGRFGIRVNAVSPGPIFTNMSTKYDKEQILHNNPLRTEITCSDIANSVVYLASGYASAINGQILCVDGGLCL